MDNDGLSQVCECVKHGRWKETKPNYIFWNKFLIFIEELRLATRKKIKCTRNFKIFRLNKRTGEQAFQGAKDKYNIVNQRIKWS